MRFDPLVPYNDLPLLPPTQELETKAILKEVIDVSWSLAELKGAAQQLPNQTLLIQYIGLQEAKNSSEDEFFHRF